MNPHGNARDKVVSRTALSKLIEQLQARGRRIVFTNGCFDLLHPGHVRYLERAKSLGDILVVAVNADESVRRLKGPTRPVLPESDRSEVVAALCCVDYVTIFEEDTPLEVIEQLRPNVLVKGGDWPKDQIVGRESVEGRGGQVVTIDFEQGYSTTGIIERIQRTGQSG